MNYRILCNIAYLYARKWHYKLKRHYCTIHNSSHYKMSVNKVFTYRPGQMTTYSRVSNKRAGCNNHAGWKISQN